MWEDVAQTIVGIPSEEAFKKTGNESFTTREVLLCFCVVESYLSLCRHRLRKTLQLMEAAPSVFVKEVWQRPGIIIRLDVRPVVSFSLGCVIVWQQESVDENKVMSFLGKRGTFISSISQVEKKHQNVSPKITITFLLSCLLPRWLEFLPNLKDDVEVKILHSCVWCQRLALWDFCLHPSMREHMTVLCVVVIALKDM